MRRAAEKEGRLIIYGPRGADQEQLYSERFQQVFPRIKVYYSAGRMSEVISRIMAEQRAGLRQADLVLGGTDILLGTLKDKGLLQPIRPSLLLPEVLDTAGWFRGRLWFADKEDKFVPMWRAVPYTAACINTNMVKAGEMKSYWDLLQPKWKSKIVSQDLRIGSARNQMYTVYIRKDLGPDYLKRLYGEMDVTISRNLAQISDWIGAGKFAVAIGGIDCNDLAVKGLPVAPVHFEGIAAVGAGTDAASWLASSRNSNAAKVFLNWILSREGQMQFQKQTHANSLRIDIQKDGIVNPLGTQAPGSIPSLTLSWNGTPNRPCGTIAPKLGMTAPGADGERLVATPLLPTRTGNAWQGPGIPAPVTYPIPSNVSLLGRTLYVQGRLADKSIGAAIPLALTDGFALTLQP